MSETKDKVRDFIIQACTLREKGKLKEAITMYDQAYDFLCNDPSCRPSPYEQFVTPEVSRLTCLANLMHLAGILETGIVSDVAIVRFEARALQKTL